MKSILIFLVFSLTYGCHLSTIDHNTFASLINSKRNNYSIENDQIGIMNQVHSNSKLIQLAKQCADFCGEQNCQNQSFGFIQTTQHINSDYDKLIETWMKTQQLSQQFLLPDITQFGCARSIDHEHSIQHIACFFDKKVDENQNQSKPNGGISCEYGLSKKYNGLCDTSSFIQKNNNHLKAHKTNNKNQHKKNHKRLSKKWNPKLNFEEESQWFNEHQAKLIEMNIDFM